jgi:hypothetical protein
LPTGWLLNKTLTGRRVRLDKAQLVSPNRPPLTLSPTPRRRRATEPPGACGNESIHVGHELYLALGRLDDGSPGRSCGPFTRCLDPFQLQLHPPDETDKPHRTDTTYLVSVATAVFSELTLRTRLVGFVLLDGVGT